MRLNRVELARLQAELDKFYEEFLITKTEHEKHINCLQGRIRKLELAIKAEPESHSSKKRKQSNPEFL